MKELTIEQKAKAYDEAIKRGLDYIRHTPATEMVTRQDIFEAIFPEFKESEDEKIRKLLIGGMKNLNYSAETFASIPIKDVIAWLEKQGESYTKKDVDDAYFKGISDAKNESEKQYEANYQIRKDIATFIFNYRGDIKDRAEWMNYLGIKVSLVEKQGKQRSADKVEPKFKVGDIIRFKGNETLKGEVEAHKIVGYDNELYVFADGTTDLFCEQDLYELVEQKPTWSEEDEKYLQELIEWIDCFIDDEDCGDMTYDEHKEFYMTRINWLKSLKDRYTWKPSDEQMELLEMLVEDNNQRYFYTTLNSLYEQLKKLKGE